MKTKFTIGKIVMCSNNQKDWIAGVYRGVNRFGEHLLKGCSTSFQFIEQFDMEKVQ